jgi:hypothetical protein
LLSFKETAWARNAQDEGDMATHNPVGAVRCLQALHNLLRAIRAVVINDDYLIIETPTGQAGVKISGGKALQSGIC